MKIKSKIAALAIAALSVTGAATVASTATATETQNDLCVPIYETQPNPDYVEAWTEITPAVGEPTIEVVDTEAWTETIEHEAEGYTEYKFVHKFDWLHLNPKWKTDPNWNAESNHHSKGWLLVGERFVETKVAWTETIEHEATYKTVENPDYVAEQVIEHPAVGEPTIEVQVGETCEEPPVVDFCDPSNKQATGSIGTWLANNEVNKADCFTVTEVQACGSLDVQVDFAGPYVYAAQYVEGSGATPIYPGAESFPATFEEDYNGGSVDVSYWLVGPESDYLTGSGIPNFWDGTSATVTVDTDCEEPTSEPEPTPTPEPTPSETPTTEPTPSEEPTPTEEPTEEAPKTQQPAPAPAAAPVVAEATYTG